MNSNEPTRRIFSERIPPSAVPSAVAEALGHESPRAKVKAIIDDYVSHVSFEELVMKYAGKEIERRSLGNIKFWAFTVLSTIVTTIVTIKITAVAARW